MPAPTPSNTTAAGAAAELAAGGWLDSRTSAVFHDFTAIGLTAEHPPQGRFVFTVRVLPGRLSALSVLHSKSVLYGTFCMGAQGA